MKIFPSNWKTAAIRTSVAIILILIVNAFFIKVFRGFGQSMEPTVKDNAFVFVNRLAYRHHLPDRGDIVVFRTSDKPYVYFLKRVIGLPGETVEFKNGQVYINGIMTNQIFPVFKGNWTVKPFKVQENYVFVAGDNRNFSWDEQLHPQVNIKNITGKVIGYQ